MAIPHWEADPDAWDTLLLGDVTMPGIWTVTNCAASRDIDVKKIKGSDGARLRDQGYEPAIMTFRGLLHEEQDWIDLQEVIPKLHPRQKGGLRFPLEVQHPKTQLLSIPVVYINKINTPELENGILSIDIEAIEWFDNPVRQKQKPKDMQTFQKFKLEQRATVFATPVPTRDVGDVLSLDEDGNVVEGQIELEDIDV